MTITDQAMDIEAIRLLVESERFQSKIDKTGDCWIWTASTNGAGYGRISFQDGPQYAHRLALAAAQGVMPTEVDHLCRNTSCVNPSHLEDVDHRTNVRRGSKSALKEMCWAGLHPWVGENIYVRPDTGRAHCKPCRIARTAEYRERKRNESSK